MEADIEIKLTAGKKLSGEEMLYLKNHDKAMYQKAKIIKRERDAYEKTLTSCKTKDEVEQLKADYASAAVRRINAIRKGSLHKTGQDSLSFRPDVYDSRRNS